jgi:hypothetical protein
MTFDRLLPADGIAMLAALALVFVMALDWFSTAAGDEARRIEAISQPQGGAGGQVEREVRDRAGIAAEEAEHNAWQLEGLPKVLVPATLLATVVLTWVAGYLRMAGRRFGPPLTPTGMAALAAIGAAGVIAYLLLNEPGLDASTTVKAGPPAALVVLGVIALACRAAMREEEAGTAWREPRAAPVAPADGQGA